MESKLHQQNRPLVLVNSISGFFLLAALEGVGCLIFLLSIPTDPKHAVLFGFSTSRLIMIAAMLAGIAAFAVLAWQARQSSGRLSRAVHSLLSSARRRSWLLVLSLVAVLLAWLNLQLEPYWYGFFHAAFERLQPFFLWAGLLGLQTFLVIWLSFGQAHVSAVRELVRRERGWPRAALVAAGAILLIALFIILTRSGITPDVMHWNVAGVPLTSLQMLGVWTGLVIVLAVALSGALPTERLRLWTADLALALLVWAGAVALWTLTPMPRSYFAPGPFPPEFVYYPYSDAAVHDMGSYYLLLGEGMNNLVPTDKPLYMTILALLHAIGGDSYQTIVTLQIMLLAAFPVLLFFFGKSFHSRAFGVLIAALAILKERNAIAATLEIRVSHSKLLMSEFPTAVGVVLFTWLMFEWLKDPDRRPLLPLWAGGVIGLTALIRPNALLLLPMGLLLILWVFGRRLRRSIITGALITAGLLVTFLPWTAYTQTLSGASFIDIKIRDVINRQSPTLQPTRPELLPTPEANRDQPDFVPAALKVRPRPALSAEPESIIERYRFVVDHFLHNQVTAVLGLTAALPYQDLDHTLDETYWVEDPFWDGRLDPAQALMLALNLVVIACGLGLAWSRWQIAGLAPLAAQIGYSAANALARTSGARYLVPFDWVVYFYFALGLLQLTLLVVAFFNGLRRPVFSPPAIAPMRANPPVHRYALVGAALLAMGFSLPLLSQAMPPRLPAPSPAELEQRLRAAPLPEGVDRQTVDTFLADPNAALVSGFGLYPRFFYEPEAVFFASERLGVQQPGVNRLGLTLLTADEPLGVSLPLAVDPGYFPHAQNMIVLGCRTGRMIDALAVLTDDPAHPVYWRSPWPAEFSCPAP